MIADFLVASLATAQCISAWKLHRSRQHQYVVLPKGGKLQTYGVLVASALGAGLLGLWITCGTSVVACALWWRALRDRTSPSETRP